VLACRVQNVQEGAWAEAVAWTPEFQAAGWVGKVTAWSDWFALGVSIDMLVVGAPCACSRSFGAPQSQALLALNAWLFSGGARRS
jgi:hypothetical protein